MAETKSLNMAQSKLKTNFNKNQTNDLNNQNTSKLTKKPTNKYNSTKKLNQSGQNNLSKNKTSNLTKDITNEVSNLNNTNPNDKPKIKSKNKTHNQRSVEINPNKILKDARERAKQKPKNKVVANPNKNKAPKYDRNGRKYVDTSFVKRDILGDVDPNKIPKSHVIDTSKKIPEVSEMSKFYELLIEKITALYKANKKASALEIIREELNQPYMPLEYLELFEQLALKIEGETKQEKYIKRYNNMSKLELLDKFYSPGKHTCDVFLFQYFLNKYRGDLKLADMLYIQDVFLDKEMRNEDKLFLIEHLNQFKISYEFKFYNSYTGESSSINPRNHLLPDKIPLFTEALILINRKCFNDPSLQSLIVDLMYIMYSYFYPEPPDFTVDNFTFTLIDYAKALLTGSGYRDNEITLILQKALKGIQ